jgi:hypothetical protein
MSDDRKRRTYRHANNLAKEASQIERSVQTEFVELVACAPSLPRAKKTPGRHNMAS